MKKILLDGNKIDCRADLYRILREQLQPDHMMGKNLDALYDVLTEQPETVLVRITGMERLKNTLGGYADILLRVFADGGAIIEKDDAGYEE